MRLVVAEDTIRAYEPSGATVEAFSFLHGAGVFLTLRDGVAEALASQRERRGVASKDLHGRPIGLSHDLVDGEVEKRQDNEHSSEMFHETSPLACASRSVCISDTLAAPHVHFGASSDVHIFDRLEA
jgi:hypothetical protein